jgi:hypothetical protein
LHGMAYYIFLKSMRSLEEFMKNPHVKIPPKSPSTNFQSLGKFKKSNFLIQKFFFLISARPAHPARVSVASSRKIRLPFWFASSESAASPTSLCQPGPRCQFDPPPPAARARPRHHRFPVNERRSAPCLGCHRAITASPSFPLP